MNGSTAAANLRKRRTLFLRKLWSSYGILTDERNCYVILQRTTAIRERRHGYVTVETTNYSSPLFPTNDCRNSGSSLRRKQKVGRGCHAKLRRSTTRYCTIRLLAYRHTPLARQTIFARGRHLDRASTSSTLLPYRFSVVSNIRYNDLSTPPHHAGGMAPPFPGPRKFYPQPAIRKSYQNF